MAKTEWNIAFLRENDALETKNKTREGERKRERDTKRKKKKLEAKHRANGDYRACRANAFQSRRLFVSDIERTNPDSILETFSECMPFGN